MSQTTNQNPATPTTTSTAPPNEYITRSVWKAQVLASLNVLFIVLAVRFILLVAVVGSIVLTVIAATTPDPWRLATVAAYAVIVVVPLTWLAARK